MQQHQTTGSGTHQKGLSVGTSSIQAQGTTRRSNGMAEELFFQPDMPVRTQLLHPTALGVTMGVGRLVPLPCAWSPRTTAADGDPTIPTGAQNQRQWAGSSQVLAEPPASHRLHRSV